MDGIICVDKPEGFTSFDVVAKCRGILRERRIGHGGTLDPMATGVLVLFLGRATTACDLVPVQEKSYVAGLKLGVDTDTYDITGKVVSTGNCKGISLDNINSLLPEFSGEIMQTPPMFSAIQVKGQRLYDLARNGQKVELQPRSIRVSSLTAERDGENYRLNIRCSKGTYVRSLVHDIGQKLGCGAVMTALRRTECCGFSLADCVSIEQLQAARNEDNIEQYLRPVEQAFAASPVIRLAADRVKYFVCGAESRMDGNLADGLYAVWHKDRFLGLGEMREGVCFTKKLFVDPLEIKNAYCNQSE